MTFMYPSAEARFRRAQVDWETDDIRALIVMSNSTAGADAAAEFVGDIVTLDECDGAGYARTPLVGRAIDIDAPAKIVKLLADQTDFPATSPGSRQNAAVVLYQHVGADSVNPLLVYLDDAPWFPFHGLGTPIRMVWHPVEGIVQVALSRS